jgi:cell division protein ZapA
VWPRLRPGAGDGAGQPGTLLAVDRRTVELRIAGQSYRVVSSAPEEDLHRLAGVVGAKLAELVPKGRPVPPQAMLLAAMALAHEVETVRGERESLERRTRDLLGRALGRIDDALEPFKDTEAAGGE